MGDAPEDFIDLLTENHMLYKGEVVVRCAGCQNPLLDRVMLRLRDQLWHSGCLRCSVCHQPLSHKCYTQDAANFCKEHFYRKYGTQCSGCRKGIVPLETVRRVQNLVFHMQCFLCFICGRQLETGDHFFLMEDHKLICQADYLSSSSVPHNGANNKRPRTTISIVQLEALKMAYKHSSKPSRHIREQLSTKTGLDMRVVQVWFQNRRAKERRLKKEAKKPTWDKKLISENEKESKSKYQSYIEETSSTEASMSELPDWYYSTSNVKFTVFQQILYYTTNARK